MTTRIDGLVNIGSVLRYYDDMLKKHQKRLRSLDARGVPEESRVQCVQSIAKYEIVIDALNHYSELK